MILLLIPEVLGSLILSEWISLKDMARLDTAVCQHKKDLRHQLLGLFSNSTTTAVFFSVINANFNWVALRQIKFSKILLDYKMANEIKENNRLDTSRVFFVSYFNCFATAENQIYIVNKCPNLQVLILELMKLAPPTHHGFLECLDGNNMKNIIHLACIYCSSQFSTQFLSFAAKHCLCLQRLYVQSNNDNDDNQQLLFDNITDNPLISLIQKNLATLSEVSIKGSCAYLQPHNIITLFATNAGNCLKCLKVTYVETLTLCDISRLLCTNNQLKYLSIEDDELDPVVCVNNNLRSLNVANYSGDDEVPFFSMEDAVDFFRQTQFRWDEIYLTHICINDSILMSWTQSCKNTLHAISLCNVDMMITENALRSFLSVCSLLKFVSLSNFSNYSCSTMVSLFAHDNIIEELYLSVHATLDAVTVLSIIKECPCLTTLKLNICLAVKHRTVKQGIRQLEKDGRETIEYSSAAEECCCGSYY